MPIFDLFSKRQKRHRGEVPDVYAYDQIPNQLRVQIIHIWNDTLGNMASYSGTDEIYQTYNYIHGVLCREYGVFDLAKEEHLRFPDNSCEALQLFLLNEQDIERVLDVIELTFRYLDRIIRNADYYAAMTNLPRSVDSAITELNARFKQHGIGYEFRDGAIIRIDSNLIHEKAVKPALFLLSGKEYRGANGEFLKAHEHYRHGRYKECINEALKSFESTLKIICKKRKWAYSQTDTARKLIEICLNNHLIPQFWQSHFSSLRATLESGIPTARHKLGAHGQGTTQIVVPQHLAIPNTP